MLKLLLGDPNARKLKRYQPLVSDITLLEEEIAPLSDEDLRSRTAAFQERLANAGTLENQRPILDEILPEAFAVVREAGKRVLGMRHFDVQLIGGMVLHEGQIAEMKTGEGKTLVATLPSYLNALTGRGVHVVTVNDYLARRDAEWMGQVHRFLGLSVGGILMRIPLRSFVRLIDGPSFKLSLRRHKQRHPTNIQTSLFGAMEIQWTSQATLYFCGNNSNIRSHRTHCHRCLFTGLFLQSFSS